MALSNAGSTVSNAFVTQFADDVIHAAQQKTSKLAGSVRTVRNVIGSTYKFNTLSKGGYIKNKSRFVTTGSVDIGVKLSVVELKGIAQQGWCGRGERHFKLGKFKVIPQRNGNRIARKGGQAVFLTQASYQHFVHGFFLLWIVVVFEQYDQSCCGWCSLQANVIFFARKQ
mgnify:CR=1 FL=1